MAPPSFFYLTTCSNRLLCCVKEINAQKAACAAIMESKNRVIKEFQAQLKAKDEEYVKSLKKQAEDVGMTSSSNETR